MTTDCLLVERRDAIALVTLNRPEALNALNAELRTAIATTFRALQADDAVRVAVLTGAGRAFCAGIDLAELGAHLLDPAEGGPDAAVPAAIAAFDRPLIGAINGTAATGGLELALMCDVLVAADTTLFADTHALVGIVPGWGLSQRLPRAIGTARAMEMSLSGNYIDAEQAERWGLVNRAVRADRLLDDCLDLAHAMAEAEPLTQRRYKRLIDGGALAAGLAREGGAFAAHLRDTSAADVAARIPALALRARRQVAALRARRRDGG